MRYASLDLETTSLEPSPDHILMVSFVVEDTTWNKPVEELPHFTCFVRQSTIKGQAYALGMNGWILDYISGRKKPAPYPIFDTIDNFHETHWTHEANEFLRSWFGTERVTLAGKNVGTFDLNFLPPWFKERFKHRVIDPGSLCLDWQNDDAPPSMEKCKERKGLGSHVAHDAREDAMDVIKILRSFYHKE